MQHLRISIYSDIDRQDSIAEMSDNMNITMNPSTGPKILRRFHLFHILWTCLKTKYTVKMQLLFTYETKTLNNNATLQYLRR